MVKNRRAPQGQVKKIDWFKKPHSAALTTFPACTLRPCCDNT